MKYMITLAGLLVISMGCSEKETDSAEEEEEESAFAPTEGEWKAGQFTLTSDTCGAGLGEETDDTITLTMVDDASFTLSDEEVSFDCTLSGQDFTCGALEDSMAMDGQDAVLKFVITQSGSFSSESAGTLALDWQQSCEGADCDAMAEMMGMTLPCEIVGSADFTLQ